MEMKVTNEQLKKIRAFCGQMVENNPPLSLRREAIDILDAELAAPEQEPVAWGMQRSDGLLLDIITPEEHEAHEGKYTVPLYRHPSPQSAEQEPVAWSHPDFDFAVMGKAPVNPPIEEWTPLVPLGSKSPSPQSQPVARVTGYYGGNCVIEPLDGKTVFSSGMAVYSAPVAAQAAQPDLWDGAEEWERLAFELCAEECGEEACNELIWENYEPWGDRWMMYEDEAKRMIQLVRKHTAPPSRESEQPVSNTGFCIGLPPLSAPPSREWVGLTTDQIDQKINECRMGMADYENSPTTYCRRFANELDALLRTKNTGESNG